MDFYTRKHKARKKMLEMIQEGCEDWQIEREMVINHGMPVEYYKNFKKWFMENEDQKKEMMKQLNSRGGRNEEKGTKDKSEKGTDS